MKPSTGGGPCNDFIPKPGGPDPLPLRGPHCPGPEPFGPIRFKKPPKGF